MRIQRIYLSVFLMKSVFHHYHLSVVDILLYSIPISGLVQSHCIAKFSVNLYNSYYHL